MSAEPKRPATQQVQRGMRPLERERLGMLGCQGWRIVDPGENKPPPAAVRRPAAFPDRAQDADGFSRRPTG